MRRAPAFGSGGLAAVALICAAVAVAVRIWNRGLDVDAALPDLAAGAWAIDVLGAVAWCLPGLVIARRRPDLPFGWLALVAAIGHGAAAVGLQLAVADRLGHHAVGGSSWGLWFASWGPTVELPVLALIYVFFPDGRRLAGTQGRVSFVAPVVVTIGVVLQALAPYPVAFGITAASPFATERNPLLGASHPNLPPGVPFIAFGMILASATVLIRWWRASAEERTTLAGLAFLAALAPIVAVTVVALPARVGFAIAEAETFLEIAVITAVVLRHHLFGIDVVIRRVAVYGCLILLLAIVHGGLAGAASSFATPGTAATIAAIVVALVALPARDLLTRAIGRLLYGARHDPLAVMTAVPLSVDRAEPRELLQEIAVNVSAMMRLPFVSVSIPGEPTLTGESGKRQSGSLAEFELTHQGRIVGVLTAQPRAGEPSMTARDERLLQLVAQQASLVVVAITMSLDAQQARGRLVVAVEDERRRLRRDLHDGLGPSLTASAFRLDAARRVLTTQPEQSDQLIGAVRDDVAEALDDIRRLVYELSPPLLADLGLVGALRRHFDVPTGPGELVVTLDADDDLPQMPAAVEVAAYRIVTEAVTNVRKHSGARQCQVRLRGGPQLRIEVVDDGQGNATAGRRWTPGVGLIAMSERVSEVGGEVIAGPTAAGGRVCVTLPLIVGGRA